MRKVRLGLRGKFVLAVSLLLIGSCASLGWLILRNVRDIAVKETLELGEHFGRHLAEDCELGILIESRFLLDGLLGEALENEVIVQAKVRNSAGEILAEQRSFPFLESSTGMPRGLERKPGHPRDRALHIDKRYSKGLHSDIYDFTLPVLTLREQVVGEEIGFLLDKNPRPARGWETIGWVTLSISTAKSDQRIRILAREVLLVTLVVLVLGILIVIALVRIIVEPTRRLVQATRRITGGDLSSLVAVRSRDEIGDLAVSFNQMTVELKRSREVLEDYNTSLEAKVRERTRELEETQNQLVQAEKLSALGELVSGVAHELNNPLAGILGYSQLLLKTSSEPRISRGLEKIEREAQRCKKTVKNLQTFARKHLPQKKLVSISAILESTLELRAYQLSVDDIQVVKMYEKLLPPTMADFHQLQQVFLNIIINAHQAIKEVGRRGVLTLEVGRRNDRIVVSIADNGPGISPELLPKVFDPFFTTKEVGRGTGLGLSICFGIIQAHRGEILVNSRKGQGTEFRIDLPILREDSTARPAEENDQPNPSPAGKGARILVVDDEPTVAEVVAEALALDGHLVETAHDGEIALEKVRRIRFDVIITDLKMPGMTGQDFYLNIRQRDQNLARRVIFATGDIATVSTRKFLEESGNPFLQKPFEISAIRGMVLKVLEERN